MKKGNWFDFKDCRISGWSYLGRLIVSQFLYLLIVPGIWLAASTSYKRARSFNWSKETATLIAVLMSLYVPLNIIAGEFDEPVLNLFSLALAILHLTLLFKDGNKETLYEFSDLGDESTIDVDFNSGFDESDEIEDEKNSSSTEVESILNKTAISQKWEDSEKQKTSSEKIVAIKGDETVDDLIELVSGSERPTNIIALIALTTQMNRPATYYVFSYRLKSEYPELFAKGLDVLKQSLFEVPVSFTLKEKLNLRTKVVKVMLYNNLGTMAGLLDSKPLNRYNDDRVRAECVLLKSAFDLKKGPAIESLNRFKIAKAIAKSYSDNAASMYMENYIRVYNLYLEEFLD
jgi:hypothetical protein